MKALILCAGKGSRLKEHTQDLPKPLVKVNGRPVLDYILSHCRTHSIVDIAINTSYLGDKIKSYCKDGSQWGLNIIYSHEPELLGTSGALNNFRDFFNSDFLIFYGDSLSNIEITRMLIEHQKNKADLTLAVREKPLDYPSQSLLLCDEESRVRCFMEKPTQTHLQSLSKKKRSSKLINSGIYIASPSILSFIPEGFSDFGYDIIPKLIAAQARVFSFDMTDSFFREVGRPEKLKQASHDIQSLNYTWEAL